MQKAILRYQWKYASLAKHRYPYEEKWNLKIPQWYRFCRSFWLLLGIFCCLLVFASSIFSKKQNNSTIHYKRLEKHDTSETVVLDTVGLSRRAELHLKEPQKQNLLVS